MDDCSYRGALKASTTTTESPATARMSRTSATAAARRWAFWNPACSDKGVG